MMKQILRLAVYMALGWVLIRIYNEFFNNNNNPN